MNTYFEKNAFIRAREKKQCINLGQEIEFRHWGWETAHKRQSQEDLGVPGKPCLQNEF